MEEVLQVQTLMGLSVLQELSASLRSTAEAQRALADEVVKSAWKKNQIKITQFVDVGLSQHSF